MGDHFFFGNLPIQTSRTIFFPPQISGYFGIIFDFVFILQGKLLQNKEEFFI